MNAFLYKQLNFRSFSNVFKCFYLALLIFMKTYKDTVDNFIY